MPIPLLLAAAAAVQAGSSIYGGIKGAQMLKQAKKINPLYNKYQTNQNAKDMLARQQMLLNARSPFAAARDRQIQSQSAATKAAIQRGAVDPTMAIQGILASQNAADDQINQQFAMENQMQQQREANLMNAQNVMIGEGTKEYEDMWRKYQMDTDQKNALRQAGTQSIVNAGSNLASSMIGFYNVTKGLPPKTPAQQGSTVANMYGSPYGPYQSSVNPSLYNIWSSVGGTQ